MATNRRQTSSVKRSNVKKTMPMETTMIWLWIFIWARFNLLRCWPPMICVWTGRWVAVERRSPPFTGQFQFTGRRILIGLIEKFLIGWKLLASVRRWFMERPWKIWKWPAGFEMDGLDRDGINWWWPLLSPSGKNYKKVNETIGSRELRLWFSLYVAWDWRADVEFSLPMDGSRVASVFRMLRSIPDRAIFPLASSPVATNRLTFHFIDWQVESTNKMGLSWNNKNQCERAAIIDKLQIGFIRLDVSNTWFTLTRPLSHLLFILGR